MRARYILAGINQKVEVGILECSRFPGSCTSRSSYTVDRSGVAVWKHFSQQFVEAIACARDRSLTASLPTSLTENGRRDGSMPAIWYWHLTGVRRLLYLHGLACEDLTGSILTSKDIVRKIYVKATLSRGFSEGLFIFFDQWVLNTYSLSFATVQWLP